jgi:hypothetical protein
MSLHVCPHCLKPGVSSSQKLNSYFFAPAECRLCHRRSYLHYTHGVRAMVVWVCLTWIFIGIAIFQQMPMYLIGTFPAMLLAVDNYMLRAPLLGLD